MTLLDTERAKETKGKRGRWMTGHGGNPRTDKGKKRIKARGCEKDQKKEKNKSESLLIK